MASLPPFYLRQNIKPLAASFPATLTSSHVASRAFSTSPSYRTLKESDIGRENLNIEYENHKQDNLKNVKAGKGYWREELASESEADVKADRGETSISENDIKGLKEQVVKGGKK